MYVNLHNEKTRYKTNLQHSVCDRLGTPIGFRNTYFNELQMRVCVRMFISKYYENKSICSLLQHIHNLNYNIQILDSDIFNGCSDISSIIYKKYIYLIKFDMYAKSDSFRWIINIPSQELQIRLIDLSNRTRLIPGTHITTHKN